LWKSEDRDRKETLHRTPAPEQLLSQIPVLLDARAVVKKRLNIRTCSRSGGGHAICRLKLILTMIHSPEKHRCLIFLQVEPVADFGGLTMASSKLFEGCV
jgi:hypothetical protein